MKTAVLVIDVQRGIFGATPPPFEGQTVIARINSLLARARTAGVPVIFIQHDGTAEENLTPQTPGWELHPGLARVAGDRVIRKTAADPFYETSLESALRSLGIERLVVSGYATDFCVDAAVRSAVGRNFEVVVAADAHTTSDSPFLKAPEIRRHQNWVWENTPSPKPVRVVPADQIVLTPA